MKRALIAPLLLALAFAACSDDDADGTATPSATTPGVKVEPPEGDRARTRGLGDAARGGAPARAPTRPRTRRG